MTDETRDDPPGDDKTKVVPLDPSRRKGKRKSKGAGGSEGGSSRYVVERNRHCLVSHDPEAGQRTRPLCDFAARIVRVELYDDGARTRLYYVIEGVADDGTEAGDPLPEIRIPASAFPGLGWLYTTEWAGRAHINAGSAVKDQVRAAIEAHSGRPPRIPYYAHTGWRQIGGEWLYLHAGGAIGAGGNRTDVAVDLGDDNLNRYRLPEPPTGEELKRAVRASLDLLDIAPGRPEIGALLLALAYRAPLAECAPLRNSLWLEGKTGAFKSELTALVLQHFGSAFTAENGFPAGWGDSVSDLEVKPHVAKDALLVIDDYKPGASAKKRAELEEKAHRLFHHAVGNAATHGRRFADMEARPNYRPRGAVATSGEALPAGHSLRGRLTVLNIVPGDIPLKALSEAQAAGEGGTFALAMAGYLQWLAPQMAANLREQFRTYLRATRDKAIEAGMDGGHRRTATDYASYAAGIAYLVEFAVDVGALTTTEAVKFEAKCLTAIRATLIGQAELRDGEDEALRFLELVKSAMLAGRAHAAEASSKGMPAEGSYRLGWRQDGPLGTLIGWVDESTFYFSDQAAMAVAQQYAKDQGRPLSVTGETIWQRLGEAGLLEGEELPDGRKRFRKRKQVIHGTRDRFYAVALSALFDVQADDS